MTRVRLLCMDSRGNVRFSVVHRGWVEAERNARSLLSRPCNAEEDGCRRGRRPCRRVLLLDVDWEREVLNRGGDPYGWA